jgi:hypothetical protein
VRVFPRFSIPFLAANHREYFPYHSIACGYCTDSRAGTGARCTRVCGTGGQRAPGDCAGPAALGNGDDPGRNLYWGAAYGVRTYFRKSVGWKEIAVLQKPSTSVLERSVFYNASQNVHLVADAYRGREIKVEIVDFFWVAAGLNREKAIRVNGANGKEVEISSQPDLAVYVGHDGLMDFAIEEKFQGEAGGRREAMVLACASKAYFGPHLKPTGARPILWTTGLMAPEAYTLKDALDGWMAGESPEKIRKRAAGRMPSIRRSA